MEGNSSIRLMSRLEGGTIREDHEIDSILLNVSSGSTIETDVGLKLEISLKKTLRRILVKLDDFVYHYFEASLVVVDIERGSDRDGLKYVIDSGGSVSLLLFVLDNKITNLSSSQGIILGKIGPYVDGLN